MLKQTATDKALNASDPIGLLASGAFVVLSSLGLAEKWGLTADEVLMLVGGLGAIATGARAWFERDRRLRVLEMLEPQAIPISSDRGDLEVLESSVDTPSEGAIVAVPEEAPDESTPIEPILPPPPPTAS